MKTGEDVLALTAKALKWLQDWESLINATDFARARSLFSENVVSFGTLAEMLVGLDDLEERQWRKIWPTISGFTFHEPRILFCETETQIVALLVLWHSEGKARNGGWYHRKGRATLILKSEEDALRCIHSHLSMEPGIPPLRD
jgi:ketosteroid isomerase-like protein